MTDPPEWLSPAAREVWDTTAAELDRRGIEAQPEVLTLYANAVVQHAEASKLIDRTNVLLKGAEGKLVRNPANAVAREAGALVSRLAGQLGLTDPPPARPRRRGTRNAKAVEKTISALRAGGRLEACDDSTVALTRTLADALDRIDPDTHPAQLASVARAQLATIKLLRGLVDDDSDAGLDELLAALGDATDA